MKKQTTLFFVLLMCIFSITTAQVTTTTKGAYAINRPAQLEGLTDAATGKIVFTPFGRGLDAAADSTITKTFAAGSEMTASYQFWGLQALAATIDSVTAYQFVIDYDADGQTDGQGDGTIDEETGVFYLYPDYNLRDRTYDTTTFINLPVLNGGIEFDTEVTGAATEEQSITGFTSSLPPDEQTTRAMSIDNVEKFTGAQSLKMDVVSDGSGSSKAQFGIADIPIDGVATYLFSFYGKRSSAYTDHWTIVRPLNSDMQVIAPPTGLHPLLSRGNSSLGTDWTKVTWEISEATLQDWNTGLGSTDTIKYFQISIQLSKEAGTYSLWFDEFNLMKVNSTVLERYTQSFDGLSLLPPEFSFANLVGPISVEEEALKIYMPDLTGDSYGNPGWGQQVTISLNHRPVSADNCQFRFRTKVDNFDGFCVYSTPTPLTSADRETKTMQFQTRIFKGTEQLEASMATATYAAGDRWVNVLVDFSAAFNALGEGEAFSKIVFSVGTNAHYRDGNIYFDDFKFGHPPVVTFLGWEGTLKTSAGWDINAVPTRDAEVYIVPALTELFLDSLEAVVSRGEGVKQFCQGGQDNTISTMGLGADTIVEYVAVAYRDEEDMSDGTHFLWVYPESPIQGYTAGLLRDGDAIIPDGSPDEEAWGLQPFSDINLVSESDAEAYEEALVAEPNEYSARFKALYDANALYLLFEINEINADSIVSFPYDTISDLDLSSPWKCDAIELVFEDGENPRLKSVLAYTPNAGNDAQRPDQVLTGMFISISDQVEGTYYYEIAYAWSGLRPGGVQVDDVLKAEFAAFNNVLRYDTVSKYKLYWNGPTYQSVGVNDNIIYGDLVFGDEVSSGTSVSTYAKQGSDFRVFPTLVESTTKVECEDGIDAVAVYTVTGRIMNRKVVNSNETTLNLSGYPAGQYFIAIENSKGFSYKQIIKK